MKNDPPPITCPKCGSLRVACILWRVSKLFGQEQEDIAACRAIVGSTVGSTWKVPADAPTWACVSCTPDWGTLGRLALEEYEWQLAKEDAVRVEDFERAGELKGLQKRRKEELVVFIETLLKRRSQEA